MPPKGQRTQNTKDEDQIGRQKRFKMTASGRVKAGVAASTASSHNADYIRRNRGTKILAKGIESLVKWYMPYAR